VRSIRRRGEGYDFWAAGMQVRSRAGVHPFGHDAGYGGTLAKLQLVRQSRSGKRFEGRIGDDHFILAAGRRVDVVSRLSVHQLAGNFPHLV
jgi:hypothetical protein